MQMTEYLKIQVECTNVMEEQQAQVRTQQYGLIQVLFKGY